MLKIKTPILLVCVLRSNVPQFIPLGTPHLPVLKIKPAGRTLSTRYKKYAR